MSQPHEKAPRPALVLVVDDSAPNRLLAEAILASAGYKVALAEGGEAALAMFKESTPDLVLLDILMPGMDGFETLKALRALPNGHAVPVMLLTALTDLQSIQRSVELGADDFLTKPINRTELLMRVWSLLGIRNMRLELQRGSEEIKTEKENLARTERMKDELTALILHDMKHPLTTIYFNAGMLRRDATLSAKAQEKLSRIIRACEMLDGMLLGILDVTRSEDGSLTLNLQQIEVTTLLDEVVSSMGPRAELNQQKLELTSSLETPRIQADRDMLRRTLENLIDNSTKYAPPNTTIRFEAKNVEGALEFRVRDEGPGIPADSRSKVFDKYHQLDRDVSKRGRTSRGLGLVFCKVAAEAHGGKIWVEDNGSAASGSCFCVRIPVRP